MVLGKLAILSAAPSFVGPTALNFASILGGLKTKFTGLLAPLKAFLSGPAGIIAVGATLGLIAAVIINKLNPSLEDLQEKYKEINSKYKEMTGEGSEYYTLMSKKTDELTGKEIQRLAVLQAQVDKLKEQNKVAAQRVYDKYTHEQVDDGSNDGYATGGGMGGGVGMGNYNGVPDATTRPDEYDAAISKLRELNSQQEAGTITAEAYKAKSADLVETIGEGVDVYQNVVDSNGKMSEADKKRLESGNDVMKAYVDLTKETQDNTSATGENSDAASDAVSSQDDFAIRRVCLLA